MSNDQIFAALDRLNAALADLFKLARDETSPEFVRRIAEHAADLILEGIDAEAAGLGAD